MEEGQTDANVWVHGEQAGVAHGLEKAGVENLSGAVSRLGEGEKEGELAFVVCQKERDVLLMVSTCFRND